MIDNKILSSEIDEIKRLRFVEHLTLAEIGKRFGVSRQRVHQLVGSVNNKLPSEKRNIAKPGSTTRKAMDAESYIVRVLESHGIRCKLQPNGAQFDILANGYRANVKARYTPVRNKHSCTSPYWQWNLSGRENCDIIILIAVPLDAIFVIPERDIPHSWAAISFCYPTDSNISKQRWSKYQDRFSIFQTPNTRLCETQTDSTGGQMDRELYRTKITSIYMKLEQKEIVKRLADEQHISFSAAIDRIIREWAAAQTQTPG